METDTLAGGQLPEARPAVAAGVQIQDALTERLNPLIRALHIGGLLLHSVVVEGLQRRQTEDTMTEGEETRPLHLSVHPALKAINDPAAVGAIHHPCRALHLRGLMSDATRRHLELRGRHVMPNLDLAVITTIGGTLKADPRRQAGFPGVHEQKISCKLHVCASSRFQVTR